jgi:hypothetical protein
VSESVSCGVFGMFLRVNEKQKGVLGATGDRQIDWEADAFGGL